MSVSFTLASPPGSWAVDSKSQKTLGAYFGIKKPREAAPQAASAKSLPKPASSGSEKSKSAGAPPLVDEDEEEQAVLKPLPAPTADDREACFVCDDGGMLLVCDACDNGFHLECAEPPLKSVPPGDWFCAQCALVRTTDAAVVLASAASSSAGIKSDDGGATASSAESRSPDSKREMGSAGSAFRKFKSRLLKSPSSETTARTSPANEDSADPSSGSEEDSAQAASDVDASSSQSSNSEDENEGDDEPAASGSSEEPGSVIDTDARLLGDSTPRLLDFACETEDALHDFPSAPGDGKDAKASPPPQPAPKRRKLLKTKIAEMQKEAKELDAERAEFEARYERQKAAAAEKAAAAAMEGDSVELSQGQSGDEQSLPGCSYLDADADEDNEGDEDLRAAGTCSSHEPLERRERSKFYCLTCTYAWRQACCTDCAEICHRGHKLLLYPYTVSLDHCDCPSSGLCDCYKPDLPDYVRTEAQQQAINAKKSENDRKPKPAPPVRVGAFGHGGVDRNITKQQREAALAKLAEEQQARLQRKADADNTTAGADRAFLVKSGFLSGRSARGILLEAFADRDSAADPKIATAAASSSSTSRLHSLASKVPAMQQSDEGYLRMLTHLRTGDIDESDVKLLRSRTAGSSEHKAQSGPAPMDLDHTSPRTSPFAGGAESEQDCADIYQQQADAYNAFVGSLQQSS